MGENALSRNPIENPTTNITNFTRSLECMDELLIQHDAPRITITAQDVPNMTGDGSNIAGTKDMLITSISKLSQRSRRIRFVSYGTDLRDIILLHKAHDARDNFVTPDYFIRGAITQLDKNVLSSRIGAAANHDNWNTAFSGGQGVSFIGLDLNIGLVSSLQMIPGVTSNNVLALWDRGAGTDIGGRINSVGTFFDFGIDRRDGIGQAIRNMTDLAVIEIIGKLLDLPYLTCLPLNHHSPAVQALIQREYQRYSQNPRKLIRTVQARLRHFSYYSGPVHGIMDRQTSLALEYFRNLYQHHQPYGGTGGLDFDLYYQLMYGQQYAWHFDQLRYPRQSHFARQPRTQIPEALRYSATTMSSATDAASVTGQMHQVQHPPQLPSHSFGHRPTATRQHTPTRAHMRNATQERQHNFEQQQPRRAPTQRQSGQPEYSPPRVVAEDIPHDRSAQQTPLPIPVSPSKPAVTQSAHSPRFGNPKEYIAMPGNQVTNQKAPNTSQPAHPTPLINGLTSHPQPQAVLGPTSQNELRGEAFSEGLSQSQTITREAAFGPPRQTPRQKHWPAQEQRYPYERGESWDRSISQELQLYEHYRP
jgi:hypothetical protein